jgi:hypothetical protein
LLSLSACESHYLNEWRSGGTMIVMTNPIFILEAVRTVQRSVAGTGPGTPARPETPRELRRRRRRHTGGR